MKQQEFDKLEFTYRSNYVFHFGNHIDCRLLNGKLVDLYLVDDYFVEVHYEDLIRIEKIEAIDREKIISFYFSEMNIYKLFTEISQVEFDQLNHEDRSNYLYTNGEFIAFREENYDHLAGLYSLHGFFVEVHFKRGYGKEISLETVKDEAILSMYLSEIDLSSLFV